MKYGFFCRWTEDANLRRDRFLREKIARPPGFWRDVVHLSLWTVWIRFIRSTPKNGWQSIPKQNQICGLVSLVFPLPLDRSVPNIISGVSIAIYIYITIYVYITIYIYTQLPHVWQSVDRCKTLHSLSKPSNEVSADEGFVPISVLAWGAGGWGSSPAEFKVIGGFIYFKKIYPSKKWQNIINLLAFGVKNPVDHGC